MTSEPRNPRILIFDSGVGGLSIAREVRARLPGCDLIYASDNAAFPYGTKTEDELVSRVDAVLKALLAHYPADIVVVACNSASTLALPHIRAHFSQPIVGVVPAIKPAAERSQSRVIGLLATPGTVSRAYTRELIESFASECTVISVGSSELVTLAEQQLRGQIPGHAAIQTILAPFREHPRGPLMDTLVLACTHFPLLREQIAANLPGGVTLIDSGEAIARRTGYWVEQLGLNPGSTPVQQVALFTREDAGIEPLKPALAAFGFEHVDYVEVGWH
ncbi:glutamate racemase [Marinimicrobium alkaliphilum]|uniref:glutamate racemase n=1 Tax=Marinimicrobium alkaliphilum TaxID=2202654 RepID=UPI000DBA6691|nr:glutamate racemase [Marinimicrobium alkaliphilum]